MKILQISDIHWTKRNHWDADFPGMKERFLEDVREYIEAGNEIDYIFICGDIAFKGVTEEYNNALKYIDDIRKIIGCAKEDVFVVPGNHDLNRKAQGSEMREMINASLAFAPNNEGILENVVLKSDVLRKALFTAFADYNSFASNFFCQEILMNKCINCEEGDRIGEKDDMFYQSKLSKKVGDFNVVIRGINTALNCDKWDWNEENEENLAGHLQILPRRAYTLKKVEKQELRIIMGHHPLPFLTSNKSIKEYLDNHYHIQLFGHVHKQYVGEGNCVMVQSGAFDPPKCGKAGKYLPVYNIIEISQKDSTHVVVRGNSQIWDKNKFVVNTQGCFEKEIMIERNINKWGKSKTESQDIDNRIVKFKFMKQDDRAYYFSKIAGVDFAPDAEKTEYDNCLEFLSVLEKKGKLAKLNAIMR